MPVDQQLLMEVGFGEDMIRVRLWRHLGHIVRVRLQMGDEI